MSHTESPTGRNWKNSFLIGAWLAGMGFAVYIIATYAWSGWHRRFALWNTLLGNLHVPQQPMATLGIGLHLLAGAVISILGPLQLIPTIRQRFPQYHRTAGRIYLFAALTACLGGNAFIALNGTVGGPVMSIAFSIYGWLLGICAVQAGRMAVQGNIEAHRKWALRLFALGIGPLLYRIEYGLWALVMKGLVGHTKQWQGPLDYVMDFFFYVPNLIICELYLRISVKQTASRAYKWGIPIAAGLGLCVLALGLLLVGPHWWYPVAKKVWLQLP